MAHLMFSTYPGTGQRNLENLHYSSAVRVGNRVEVSGQTGRDTTTGVLQPDVALQTAQAFANVGLALRNAGFEAGWSHVFKVVSYHAPRLDAEALSETVKNLKEHCPDHAPLWTCIGVNSLAGDEAVRVEVEVVADVGNGA